MINLIAAMAGVLIGGIVVLVLADYAATQHTVRKWEALRKAVEQQWNNG